MRISTLKSIASKTLTAFVLVMLVLTALPARSAVAATEIITTVGDSTWVAPAGVYSVTIEVWGGGGRGAAIATGSGEDVGGGGGGGAYAIKANIAVTPGNPYTVHVGAGSNSASAGGDSYFISAVTVMAKGGNSAANDATGGATGGSLTNSVGDTRRAGGNGANGNTGSNYGGGGGSSAGTGANGNNATNATGATAPAGGGPGGNGRSGSSGNGSAPVSGPGGGGGGAYRSFLGGSTTYAGGSGANGQVRITYTILTTTIGDGTSPASKTVKGGDTNKDVSAFTVSTDSGTDTINTMVVTVSGTGPANVAAVKIYQDNGGTPNELDATDTPIGTASYSSPTATFSGLGISATTTSAQYLIVVDMVASPVNGETILAEVTDFTTTNAKVESDLTDATLTVDSAAPTVSSINRADANPTNAASVNWTVIFNESVTGVDMADFALAATGVSGESITGATGSGSTYTVTASTGTGNGTLGLNIAASPVISDTVGNALTAGFTGQVYDVDKRLVTTTSLISSDTSTTYGDSVTFTATVTDGATGNVNFLDNGVLISAVALDGNSPNQAVLNYAGLIVVGSPHSVTTVYVGDTTYGISTSSPVSQTVDPKALTISGLSVESRIYNGSAAAALSGVAELVGVVPGDTVTLGGTPVANFDNKNAGPNKPVTVSGYSITDTNYSLTQPAGLAADILAATVTPQITAEDKVYDGTTAATILTRTLTGVVGTDDVTLTGGTATFADAAMGIGKTVTVTGLSLGGTESGNYVLSSTSATTTASINASISGNAGLAGVTLSYTDGTAKTATSIAGGAYTLVVSPHWNGTVTPSLFGYTFTPADRSYTDVMANVTGDNYTPNAIPVTIRGNAGISSAVMNYNGGLSVTADTSGVYEISVPYNWSGTVTPTLSGYAFTPVSRTYTNLVADSNAQNYSAMVSSVIYYVDNTSSLGTCSDTLNNGLTPNHAFCTISKAALIAAPGNTVNVMAGTYAEKVRPTFNGTAGNPITFSAGVGVVMTGSHDGTGSDNAFRLNTKSYIVINGFTITDTVDEGIYVTASDHISVLNNIVTLSGSPVAASDRAGIYLYNTADSLVSGNTTAHNTSHGIDIEGGSSNITISNNTSYANAYEVTRVVNGIMVQGSSVNTSIIHNTVYNNEDTGIGLNGTSHSNTVVGNLVYGNGDHGIDCSESYSNVIVGNTVQGNVTVGINLEGAVTGAHDSTVQNNIVVDNGIAPPTGLPGNIRVDTLSIPGTTVDYNIVWQTGGGSLYQYIWGTTQFTTLAAFQTASGQEVHGYQANPQLVAPAAPAVRPGLAGHPTVVTGDYHITSASPAIDSANSDAPGETTTDLDGLARIDIDTTGNTGAGTRLYDDRGAHEYHKQSQTVSFTSVAPTNATVGVGSYTPTGTATSGLTVAFTIDGSASSVCSISAGVVSFNGIGTCVINANQAGNANYDPAPQVQQSFAVKSNQTVSFTSTAPTQAGVGGATYTPMATATSSLTVDFTIDASAASVCSISAGEVSFTGVGTCVINANQAGNGSYNPAPQVQQSFAVKNNQTVSFTSTAPTDATVGGATYIPTATATSGLMVDFTIDASASVVCSISAGEVSFIGIGNCVINANQTGDSSYNPAPQVQQSFAVRATTVVSLVSDNAVPVFTELIKFTATLNAGATGNVNFYNGAAIIGTSALSGGTPNQAILNYAGLDAAGSPHAITAEYVGDSGHFGSTSMVLPQVVNPKSITITPDAGQTKVFGESDPTPFSYTHSALNGTDTISGTLSRVAGEDVATYVFVTSTLDAGPNYSFVLAPAAASFSITPRQITITPTPGQSKVFGASDPTFTYDHTALIGTDSINGVPGRESGENVGTYAYTLGSLNAGTNYDLVLTDTPSTFEIVKADQIVIFTSTTPIDAVVDGAIYTPTAIGGGSGNPVVFTIDATASAVCSISAGDVSFDAAGTCVINANQAGNEDYNAAPQVQQSFAVGKGEQAINFTSTAPTAAVVGETYTPTATGGASSNPVVFTIDDSAAAICSISAGEVTFDAAGTCVINANQAGDDNYNAAPQVQQAFLVSLPVNHDPVITEGESVLVTMSQNGSPTAFDLTLNATDEDGHTLTWRIETPADHGIAGADGTGLSKVITYMPVTDYVGTDSFVVTVSDGHGGSDTITVNVTITAVLPPTFTVHLPLIFR